MRVAFLASATLMSLSLVLTSCGEPRQVGDIYVQGDVSSFDYYAEFREKQSNGKERIYLLIDPATVRAFAAGAKELPLSRTFIGAGPNKETIQVEQVKDGAQSLISTQRIIRAFNAKNNASVKIP